MTRLMLLSVIAVLSLSGCATKAVLNAQSDYENVDQKMARAPTMAASVSPRIAATQFLGARSVSITAEESAPASLEQYRDFSRGRTTFQSVVDWIGDVAGLSVRIAPDVFNSATTGSAAGQELYVRATYENTKVRHILDAVCNQIGVTWKYQGGILRIYRYDTQAFRINAVPGNSNISSSVGSSVQASGSGGGSGSGGNNRVDTSATVSAWDSYKDLLTSIKSGGGKFAINQAAGTITYTDYPDLVAKFAEIIKRDNVRLARQVTFKIEIYEISSTDSSEAGIDWGLIAANLAGNKKFSYKSPASLSSTGAGQFVFNFGTDGYSASAVAKLLSTAGKVSHVKSTVATAMHNQPASVSVPRDVWFIRGQQLTPVANVGVIKSTQQDVIQVGYFLNLTPSIADNDSILLRIAFRLRDVTLRTQPDGTESPDTTGREMTLPATLSSGETLMLAGLEDGNTSRSKQGILDGLPWLGGTSRASTDHTSLVMLITPHIIEGAQ